MHLAILMTNTDESAFAQRHDKDGVKFAKLIALTRPDWRCTSFSVKDGIFPEDITAFDGVMITGSPASVHDADAWVPRLLELIRQIVAENIPVFGACFGHQAIALALGGQVGLNPGGWVMGAVQTEVTDPAPWMTAAPGSLTLHAAHKEQVTQLPEGARILTRTDGCDVGSFAIGNSVYTTQYHPEISTNFMGALIEELSGEIPEDVLDSARENLLQDPDTVEFSETIAAFFEQAKRLA